MRRQVCSCTHRRASFRCPPRFCTTTWGTRSTSRAICCACRRGDATPSAGWRWPCAAKLREIAALCPHACSSSSPALPVQRRWLTSHVWQCFARRCLIGVFALLSPLPPHQIWPDYYCNPCICNLWPFSSARDSGAGVPQTHHRTAPLTAALAARCLAHL